MTTTQNPTKLFRVISIFALLWNAIGAFQFFVEMSMTEETLSSYPQDIQNFMHNIPSWFTYAFGIAVFVGFIGSLGLVLRKNWSILLLQISFLAVFAMTFYDFFMQDDVAMTVKFSTMPIVVFVISLFLLIFSRRAKFKGYLN
jgi:hypothetical protein